MKQSNRAPSKGRPRQGEVSTISKDLIVTENEYRIEGRHYTRVTSIISDTMRNQQLEVWRGRVGNQMADKRRNAGADHGKAVHRACVLKAQGIEILPFDFDERMQAQLDAFKKWFDLMVAEVLATEETIYNNRYGYAGTLDLRAVLKGDKLASVIDYKSGFYNEEHCRMQTAAYKNGDGVKASRRIIVDLNTITADGLPTIHVYKNHQQDYQAFLYCLGIYNWKRSVKN